MARKYEDRVELPDGRHFDWWLLAAIEHELQSRRERWLADMPAAYRGVSLAHPHYDVDVKFQNGSYTAADVNDARAELAREHAPVERIWLTASSRVPPTRHINVALYPADETGSRTRSFASASGDDQTEVYGVLRVIRELSEASADRGEHGLPAVLPGAATAAPDAVAGPQDVEARHANTDDHSKPPWWREHAAKLVVGGAVAVIAAIAQAVFGGGATPTP